MTPQSLFLDDDPDKPPPKTPHNGTPTSRITATLAKTFAATQQETVFEFIEQAGDRGATDQEIEIGLGIAGNSVRPRRRKLVELGRVKQSGNLRLTSSNSPAVVWVVTPPNEIKPAATSAADWPLDSNPDKAPAETVLDFTI